RGARGGRAEEGGLVHGRRGHGFSPSERGGLSPGGIPRGRLSRRSAGRHKDLSRGGTLKRRKTSRGLLHMSKGQSRSDGFQPRGPFLGYKIGCRQRRRELP